MKKILLFSLTCFVLISCKKAPIQYQISLESTRLNIPAPELPRVFIDTTYKLPTGPVVIVHIGEDLQAAIDRAVYNSTIVLDSGGTWTGNYQVKPKTWSNNGWIYIISSKFFMSSGTSQTPQPGTRVKPQDAINMAKIVTPNQASAMLIEFKPSGALAASHIRFVGIEMTSISTANSNPNSQPWPTNGQTGAAIMLTGANNIIVDRCYLHGSPTQDVQRAVAALQGSSYISIIDSDLEEIHSCCGNEAQAFLMTGSLGPVKIVNNLLSATTEDVMFGGAGVNLPAPLNGYVPSDIEIRGNNFFKPEEWIPMTTGTRPWKWTEKNNLEFKSAQRVLVTGNTLQNAWSSGQYGSNLLLTPRSYQSGPNTVVDDITVDSNIMLNANWSFSMIGKDDLCKPPECLNQGESKRVLISHNMIKLRPQNAPAAYKPEGFSIGRAEEDYELLANTITTMNGTVPWSSFFFNQGKCPVIIDPPVNFWIMENVSPQGITGDCGYTGQKALDMYMPQPAPPNDRYKGNIIQ